jgi:hypothetical protein
VLLEQRLVDLAYLVERERGAGAEHGALVGEVALHAEHRGVRVVVRLGRVAVRAGEPGVG